MRAEDDEIDGMAVVQRDADLAVGLEAADAGAVAGARIDDHVGPLPGLHLDAVGREDLQQHLVGRPRQGLAVESDLVIVDEHRRRAGRLVRDILLGALAQNVERERGALRRVDRVGLGIVGEGAVLLRLRRSGAGLRPRRSRTSAGAARDRARRVRCGGSWRTSAARTDGRPRCASCAARWGVLRAVCRGHRICLLLS